MEDFIKRTVTQIQIWKVDYSPDHPLLSLTVEEFETNKLKVLGTLINNNDRNVADQLVLERLTPEKFVNPTRRVNVQTFDLHPPSCEIRPVRQFECEPVQLENHIDKEKLLFVVVATGFIDFPKRFPNVVIVSEADYREGFHPVTALVLKEFVTGEFVFPVSTGCMRFAQLATKNSGTDDDRVKTVTLKSNDNRLTIFTDEVRLFCAVDMTDEWLDLVCQLIGNGMSQTGERAFQLITDDWRIYEILIAVRDLKPVYEDNEKRNIVSEEMWNLRSLFEQIDIDVVHNNIKESSGGYIYSVKNDRRLPECRREEVIVEQYDFASFYPSLVLKLTDKYNDILKPMKDLYEQYPILKPWLKGLSVKFCGCLKYLDRGIWDCMIQTGREIMSTLHRQLENNSRTVLHVYVDSITFKGIGPTDAEYVLSLLEGESKGLKLKKEGAWKYYHFVNAGTYMMFNIENGKLRDMKRRPRITNFSPLIQQLWEDRPRLHDVRSSIEKDPVGAATKWTRMSLIEKIFNTFLVNGRLTICDRFIPVKRSFFVLPGGKEIEIPKPLTVKDLRELYPGNLLFGSENYLQLYRNFRENQIPSVLFSRGTVRYEIDIDSVIRDVENKLELWPVN